MLKSFHLRRPSAPLLLSVVALFFAFGGASYAAITIPNNSVGTRQIRNNAVTYQKIAPGTIGSARINQTLVQTPRDRHLLGHERRDRPDHSVRTRGL